MGMDEILDRIKGIGYFPVLAHPERYRYMDEKDYFKIIQYSQINKLDYVIYYFQSNWPFDVCNNVLDSVKYLSNSFFNKYPNILDELFRTKKYEQFFALATYILSDDSVCFKKKYHLYESNSRDEEKIKVFCKQYFVPFTNETYDFGVFVEPEEMICDVDETDDNLVGLYALG